MKRSSKTLLRIAILAAIVIAVIAFSKPLMARRSVEKTFTALKKQDFEALAKYSDMDDLSSLYSEYFKDEDNNENMAAILDNLDYKIIDTKEINDNTVQVKTEITTVNLKPLMNAYLEETAEYAKDLFSSKSTSPEKAYKKLRQKLIDTISDPDAEKETYEVDIEVKKIDKKWVVQSSIELINALYGGIFN